MRNTLPVLKDMSFHILNNSPMLCLLLAYNALYAFRFWKPRHIRAGGKIWGRNVTYMGTDCDQIQRDMGTKCDLYGDEL